MSDDDFNRVFGARPARPNFAERVGRADPLGDGPRAAMALEADKGKPGDYRAFGAFPSNVGPRGCEVRRWLDATEIPEGIVFPYRLLLRIDFTGEDDLRIALPDTVIALTGLRLDGLREGLMREQVTFIQQYSQRVWPRVPPGEPVISRIDIVRGDGSRG